MIKRIDHNALAVSRFAGSFSEVDDLKTLALLNTDYAPKIESLFFDILDRRNIDNVTGYDLDVIGLFVGQSRLLVDGELYQYFGFVGNDQALGFGVGRLRSGGESATGIRSLSDDEYRLFIKAKIVKNNTNSTINDIIKQCQFIFSVDLVYIYESHLTVNVQLGKILTETEKAILTQLDLIPRTTCTNLNFTAQFDSNAEFFGFVGARGAAGFGLGQLAGGI